MTTIGPVTRAHEWLADRSKSSAPSSLPLADNAGRVAPVGRVYLAPLDGLRFVAFMFVLLSHVSPPDSIAGHGWVGVDLFFVISSFLFFTLFQVEYQRTGRIALVDFFIRRLLRVYPLMILAPLVFMAVMHGSYDAAAAWSEFLTIATFGDNILGNPWFRRAIPFASHLWTLSFEYQFYLVLPAFFYACVWLGRSKALCLLLVVWLACVLLRAHYAYAPHPTIYFNPILRPDSVLLGMALALIVKEVSDHLWIAAACLIASAIALIWLPSIFVSGPGNVALYAAAALFAGSCLWLALKAPWAAAFLSTKPMVYLGKRSFGLYVFHLAASYFVSTALMPLIGGNAGARGLYFLLLTLLVATIMAVVSYRFIERPFLIMKDKRAVVLSRPI